MAQTVGIDLGTTNSCVAVVEGDTPTVIPNRGGYKTTPSMVAVTETGKRLVGYIAKRQAITNAENTVFAAKRLIGRKWSSPPVDAARESAPYRVVEGPHDDARIDLKGRVYSVPEISAMILQEMKLIAEDYIDEAVEQAVITVPAYFNDNQRQATKDAGAIAGLDVIRMINEPTAAALAYGFGKQVDRLVAVYDLGGGTFDISILEIGSNEVFKVISTAGDTFLGGEDFDNRVLDWLVQGFLDEHEIDLRQDRMALQRLKDAAEKAKMELSSQTVTEINLPFIISAGQDEALHLQQTLTRNTLTELCNDLVERTIDICAATLKEAGLKNTEIEEVILVGGMTRMVAVQRKVAEYFGREPCKGVHPDEAVALGAAIQASALLDEDSEMLLLDVTPHTLGIMIVGGYVEEVIPQNSSVPTSRSKIFTTVKDNQTAVKILVIQGESEQATENELLGEFIMAGLRKAPKGQVEIEVSFDINADGIVSVSAKDLETNQEQSITVTASSGLTDDEIVQMAEESEDYLVERRTSEAFEGLRQNAERTIRDLERMFSDVEEMVQGSEFGQEALDKARDIINRAQKSIATKDKDQLDADVDTLTRTQKMFKGILAKT